MPPSIIARALPPWGRRVSRLPAALTVLGAGLAAAAQAAAAPVLDAYDVVWTSPSRNAAESMPCGGGDIGLNVWVEHGDLLIYLSRSGTFDELNGMPKLGRLRITLSPNPLADGGSFRQELRLVRGEVEIAAEKDGVKADIDVWVEVFRPVVHVDVETSRPASVTAAYEGWRLAPRVQSAAEMASNRSYLGAPEPALVRPDQVGFAGDEVRFVHRNRGRTDFDMVVAQQGLERVKGRLWNPLAGLTFGGSLSGPGFVPAGTRTGAYGSTPFEAWLLRSARPARSHELEAVLHVATTPSLAAWESGLDRIEREESADPGARGRTLAWWRRFWDRSHVFVDADRPDPSSPAWQVGRNYQVFRYQLGCNAYGAYPTKFNGGLFTFDPQFVEPSLPYSPDYRRWGGGSFTAQNQRLVYWPMLTSGDFDMMRSELDFYRRALVNAEARSEAYWGIRGACFTEQIEDFGLPVAFEYGWRRPPGLDPGIQDNAWVNHLWDTSLEFCQMALELHSYAGADVREYLPLVESCLAFFDRFYQRQELARTGHPFGPDGKLVIFPGSACETYKDALDPASTVSALRRVLSALLTLPDDELPAAERPRWQAMLARIPGLSFRVRGGHETIAPAWTWSHIQNNELPQLYPVFPWGYYGVGLPDLGLAIDTWRYGVDKPTQRGIVSWHQDAIFCARLGLTSEAEALTLEKMRDSGRRFPTWWGPGNDWVPDHNRGGSGMIGVQEMLLQAVGRKLYLFPAWPKAWNVDFKLHAPYRTVVEGVYRGGRIEEVKVSPESRAADLVVMQPR